MTMQMHYNQLTMSQLSSNKTATRTFANLLCLSDNKDRVRHLNPQQSKLHVEQVEQNRYVEGKDLLKDVLKSAFHHLGGDLTTAPGWCLLVRVGKLMQGFDGCAFEAGAGNVPNLKAGLDSKSR